MTQLTTPANSGTDVASFDADYSAVINAAGVRVLHGRVVVRVVGDDRVSFFHGMCSADINGSAPGSVLAALILTEHAHVISDLFIWVTDDALLLDIDADAWTRTRAHLERLLVADDVEFEDVSGSSVIDIEGPAALDAARVVGDDVAGSLAAWARSLFARERRSIEVCRHDRPSHFL